MNAVIIKTIEADVNQLGAFEIFLVDECFCLRSTESGPCDLMRIEMMNLKLGFAFQ